MLTRHSLVLAFSTSVIGAQIENGGYHDGAQVRQSLVPGLYLIPRGGAFDHVSASFQGSRTNEILWLVDGVRISNRLYNGVTPLDTLPAHIAVFSDQDKFLYEAIARRDEPVVVPLDTR